MLVARVNATPLLSCLPIISLLRTCLLDSEGLADIPLPSRVYSPLNLEASSREGSVTKLEMENYVVSEKKFFLLHYIIRRIREDLIRPGFEMS